MAEKSNVCLPTEVTDKISYPDPRREKTLKKSEDFPKEHTFVDNLLVQIESFNNLGTYPDFRLTTYHGPDFRRAILFKHYEMYL